MNGNAVINILCLSASMAVASGCASVVSKSRYPVTITSDPSGAAIRVSDRDGVDHFTGKTPATVKLSTRRGYFRGKDYAVTFSQPGYVTRSVEIRRGLDLWYVFGNFIPGGWIGWLIVDPTTGAMWTLPRKVNASLSPHASELTSDSERPAIPLAKGERQLPSSG